jgi:hypothetical protein
MSYKSILTLDPFTRIYDRLSSTIDQTPLNYDVVNSVIPGKPNDKSTYYQADFYDEFGIDIVAETVFNYPHVVISEKTLRPISSKRPFIIIGASGTLKILKTMGFKTYSDIIDESYDNIQDHEIRFNAVCESVRKITSQSIDKIKQDVRSVESIIEENFATLKKLQQIELSRLGKKLKDYVEN